MILVDCTFRDGGYCNKWDFSLLIINSYLFAMESAGVDYVEMGFRSFDKNGFRGACAYTTDSYLRSLTIPPRLKVGVMVNAAELVQHPQGALAAAALMFVPADQSPVSLVRFACHLHEFEATLPVCAWLKSIGYTVGINLMQVADRTDEELEHIAEVASACPLDVLYFADSLGSMNPPQTARIVRALRSKWQGALGIHTHDNMGMAVANSLRAIEEGVTWVDSTVTGMGRGPGNAQTEYMVIELEKLTGRKVNLTPLLALIRQHFAPLQARYGWGKNPYYYLAGQYGIHPTYIQEMLGDPRYGESEILSVIDHLRRVGGKKFSMATMEAGRQLQGGDATGTWSPASLLAGRDVLILGAGAGVAAHREAVERFIRESRPFVIALNTQTAVDETLIDVRAACHPFRLLADCEKYRSLPQPLVVPLASLNEVVRADLDTVNKLDFGLAVEAGVFVFNETSAVTPSSLVMAYALAIATSGKAQRILLAGFDGYGSDDPRSIEMDGLFSLYGQAEGSLPLLAITPTRYKIPASSVYAM
ncbi:MAG: aldolase catalytic domain-containing protein [Azonexus sp.]